MGLGMLCPFLMVNQMIVAKHHGSEAACVADKSQGTKDDGESYKAKMSQEQWTSHCKKSDTVSPGQDSADHFLPKVSVDAGTPPGGSGSWLNGVERIAGAVASAVAEDAKHAASAVVDLVEHPVAAAEKVGHALGDELSKGPAQVLADVGAGVGHAAQWVSQHPVETVALAGAAALGIVTAGTASPVLAALAAAGAAGTAHSVINSGERVSEHTRELSILWNPEGHSSQELGEAAKTIGSDVSGAIDMVLVTAGTVGLGAVGGKVLAAVRSSGQAAKEAGAAEVVAGQAAAEPTKGLARGSTGASAAPTDAAAQGSGAASAPPTDAVAQGSGAASAPPRDAAAQGSGAASPAPSDSGTQARGTVGGDSSSSTGAAKPGEQAGVEGQSASGSDRGSLRRRAEQEENITRGLHMKVIGGMAEKREGAYRDYKFKDFADEAGDQIRIYAKAKAAGTMPPPDTQTYGGLTYKEWKAGFDGRDHKIIEKFKELPLDDGRALFRACLAKVDETYRLDEVKKLMDAFYAYGL
jgi:hypothetical protein